MTGAGTTDVVVVGDALLDRDLVGRARRLAPDAPVPVLDDPCEHVRPGGAALAAVLAARTGATVTLVAAVADDDAGAQLRDALALEGVVLVAVPLDGATPEKVRIHADHHPLARLDYATTAGRVGPVPEAALAAVERADALLVADYGRGLAAVGAVRTVVTDAARRIAVVWDPHARGGPAVPNTTVVTPNRAELAAHTGRVIATISDAIAAARELAMAWRVQQVAVTMGDAGAVLVDAVHPALVVPTAPARGDPCGAGDCFGAHVTVALANGAVVSEAVSEAVGAATAFVARGGARVIATRGADPRRRDRSRVATDRTPSRVVATGGCFDLLHAGHVQLLAHARALGDRLVVLLNSDASIRRLKGPTRPLQPQSDRVAVLRALECVDAVEIFEEDTPVRALERLRPAVWVKGGDYALADLVEAPVVARWGGECVIVPYLAGRSTTALLEEAGRRAR